MATLELAGLNRDRFNDITAEFGDLAMKHIKFEGALANADDVRIWVIPRGARIMRVQLAVRVVGAGNIDLGYEGDGITNDTDYWMDAQVVTATGRFDSRVSAVPRTFDERDPVYVTLRASAALPATTRFDIFVEYVWQGAR